MHHVELTGSAMPGPQNQIPQSLSRKQWITRSHVSSVTCCPLIACTVYPPVLPDTGYSRFAVTTTCDDVVSEVTNLSRRCVLEWHSSASNTWWIFRIWLGSSNVLLNTRRFHQLIPFVNRSVCYVMRRAIDIEYHTVSNHR